MKAKFPAALAAVLVHEGGYSNHPQDPGGATMYGVTQRVYDGYRKGLGKKTQTVKNISVQERSAIYKKQYWDPIKGDQLPAGVDYAVFDGAVNSGVSQAVKWLQRALGVAYSGAVDGSIGVGTLAALKSIGDNDALVARICAHRLAFMKALKTWSTFGKGWSSRVAQVKKIGQAWATGSVGPDPVYEDGMDGKAFFVDAKKAPNRAAGDAAAGLGVGGFSGASGIDQAKDSIAPIIGSSSIIDNIYTILVVASVVITLGGIGYGIYARRKKAQLASALDVDPVAL
ncbi:lysozyme family protein [Phyllobacterium ifriqiyense]|uniref:Lysozyme family protein n=1 Tax=Phyllobacterium ifriqiyense TaxID=314238 RepID=A0ABU0S7X8_9HYPH|nr:glycoside hydrolase family 108 protein [Phyllobacterium ifriqiyense]MDQ0996856.1 lysozyme family protein [Phyllobacterium ifriqiyense]